jgi:hypothetical protein
MDEPKKLTLEINGWTWVGFRRFVGSDSKAEMARRAAFKIRSVSGYSDQMGIHLEFEGATDKGMGAISKMKFTPEEAKALSQLLWGICRESQDTDD